MRAWCKKLFYTLNDFGYKVKAVCAHARTKRSHGRSVVRTSLNTKGRSKGEQVFFLSLFFVLVRIYFQVGSGKFRCFAQKYLGPFFKSTKEGKARTERKGG